MKFKSKIKTYRGHINCECGATTKTEFETVEHRYRGSVYTIENVPVEVCPSCDERFFHGSVVTAMNSLAELEMSEAA